MTNMGAGGCEPWAGVSTPASPMRALIAAALARAYITANAWRVERAILCPAHARIVAPGATNS